MILFLPFPLLSFTLLPTHRLSSWVLEFGCTSKKKQEGLAAGNNNNKVVLNTPFSCVIAQLPCTSMKESHRSPDLHICALPLLSNSALRLLQSLDPVGYSLLSGLTNIPLLCLLMFLFKNMKMEWLHPFIKFLPASSEVLWMTLFLTAVIISIHFDLLLVNILLYMGLLVLSC